MITDPRGYRRCVGRLAHCIHGVRPDHHLPYRRHGRNFCLNEWLRNQVDRAPQPADRAKGWFWGTRAGFTSFISHSGGPPFQIFTLPQKLAKAEFAGTATIVFAVINAAKMIPYQNLRPYSHDTLLSAMVLIPVALIGTVAGAYLTRRISDILFTALCN